MSEALRDCSATATAASGGRVYRPRAEKVNYNRGQMKMQGVDFVADLLSQAQLTDANVLVRSPGCPVYTLTIADYPGISKAY